LLRGVLSPLKTLGWQRRYGCPVAESESRSTDDRFTKIAAHLATVTWGKERVEDRSMIGGSKWTFHGHQKRP
jgi:hypothetical protein